MGVMDHSALRVLLFCTASHEVVAETLSGAMTLLDGADGLALDFTDDTWLTDTGYYGSAAIVGGGTEDGYDSSPDQAASSLLTYTAASPKMVTGPSGTLRFGAHNLCLQSSDISNLIWTKADATAPDATTLQETATTAAHHVGQTFTLITGATYTCSVDLKYTSRQWINVALYVGGADYNHRAFDVLNGVEGLSNGPEFVSSSMISLGDGWYRCTVVCAAAAGTTGVLRIVMAQSNSTSYLSSYAGNTANQVSIRNAHLRRTPSDSTYLATTSAARYALPYEWSTAGVLQGIRVEEARTNLCLRSQEFDNAAWTKTAAAGWTSGQSGPAGASAYRFTGSASAVAYEFYQAITIVNGASYTWSIYAKAGTASHIAMYAYDASANITWFNLSNGTVGTNAAGNTATITSVGDGYYRCTLTRTVSGTSGYFNVALATADNSVITSGSVYADFFGAQLEAGSFPTSYIPTIGSTVTRAADNISLATSVFPLSATAGTLFAWFNRGQKNSATPYVVSLNNGTYSEIVTFYGSGTSLLGFVADGGVTQANPTGGTVALAATAKAALAFAANDVALVVNAGAPATDASVTLPTPTTLSMGGPAGQELGDVTLKQVIYLPRRMTNTELQTITS